MELVLLRRLVAELTGALLHRRVEQVYALPPDHLALVVGPDVPGRLWFAAGGDEPHLYLRPGSHPTPQSPPGFAMAARKALRGRRIDDITLLGDDRIVRVRCGDQALVFEMLPRRGSAYLTSAGAVAAVWTPRRGRVHPGQPYEPPQRTARPPIAQLDEAAVARLQEALDGGQTGALTRAIDGMTPMLSREAAAAVGSGATVRQAVLEVLERAASSPTEARIYAPEPLPQLATEPPSGRLELAPYALRSRRADRSQPFASVLDAAAVYYPERARLRLLQRARATIGDALARRRGRIERSLQHGAEAETAADPTRLRQLGDLLLAHPHAGTDAGVVRVTDLYGDGAEFDIAVDPSLSVGDNAARLYRRAQRIERARSLAVARRREAEEELSRLHELQDRLAGLQDAQAASDCVRLAGERGLDVSWTRLVDPEVPGLPALEPASATTRAPIPGILRLTTATGIEILVGRSARANDRLTHEIAARHDWWLHAGGPGAHVVVRNPERLAEPRPAALLASARLAAWFSRERHAGTVQVHWTQARQVQRVRGGAAGAARMQNHRTILVRPGSPTEVAAAH